LGIKLTKAYSNFFRFAIFIARCLVVNFFQITGRSKKLKHF